VKRRELLIASGAYAALTPFSVFSQKPGRLPVLAVVLSHTPPADMAGAAPRAEFLREFLRGLAALGWEDGRNVKIERHTAEGQLERVRKIFADLAARKVDIIYTAGNVSGAHQMVAEAQTATRTIPIVFIGGGADPIAQGIIKSFARPGGNATGLNLSLDLDFALKRLEVLKQVVPGIKRVAVLGPRSDFEKNIELLGPGLTKLGLSLLLAAAESENDYEQAFAAAVRGRADAVFVVNVSVNFRHRARIVALAAQHRLPAEYFFRESVESGGLVAYGVDLLDLSRRSAGYVDRILRGAKPGDLPVELPTKFELSINLKTAKALGLAIPQQVLLRADRVIE
jgi:putative ABC transport system substrate-binding protein